MSQTSAKLNKGMENPSSEQEAESEKPGQSSDQLSKKEEEKEEVVEETAVEKNIPLAFQVITAPKFCPPGYRLDSKGKCKRIMWNDDV